MWREASWGEASYLELGLLKDAVGIEHDSIDPRQLLEDHEGNADDEGLVDARAPQQGQLEALSKRCLSAFSPVPRTLQWRGLSLLAVPTPPAALGVQTGPCSLLMWEGSCEGPPTPAPWCRALCVLRAGLQQPCIQISALPGDGVG